MVQEVKETVEVQQKQQEQRLNDAFNKVLIRNRHNIAKIIHNYSTTEYCYFKITMIEALTVI